MFAGCCKGVAERGVEKRVYDGWFEGEEEAGKRREVDEVDLAVDEYKLEFRGVDKFVDLLVEMFALF